MSRAGLAATVAIFVSGVLAITLLVALAIADGQHWREMCVEAGGYVVQQGGPGATPVCVR